MADFYPHSGLNAVETNQSNNMMYNKDIYTVLTTMCIVYIICYLI